MNPEQATISLFDPIQNEHKKWSMYVCIHFIGPKTSKNLPNGLKQQRIEKFDVLVAYL